MELRSNYILKAFLASGLLSLMMIILAQGLIQFFHRGPPLPLSIILILAAICFVLSASFFERYEVRADGSSLVMDFVVTEAQLELIVKLATAQAGN